MDAHHTIRELLTSSSYYREYSSRGWDCALASQCLVNNKMDGSERHPRSTRTQVRIPDYKYRTRHYMKSVNKCKFEQDKSMEKGFHYLANIAELQRLEFILPWAYEWLKLPIYRDLDNLQKFEPENIIKNTVE